MMTGKEIRAAARALRMENLKIADRDARAALREMKLIRKQMQRTKAEYLIAKLALQSAIEELPDRDTFEARQLHKEMTLL